jgi:hypothetical protein
MANVSGLVYRDVEKVALFYTHTAFIHILQRTPKISSRSSLSSRLFIFGFCIGQNKGFLIFLTSCFRDKPKTSAKSAQIYFGRFRQSIFEACYNKRSGLWGYNILLRTNHTLYRPSHNIHSHRSRHYDLHKHHLAYPGPCACDSLRRAYTSRRLNNAIDPSARPAQGGD